MLSVQQNYVLLEDAACFRLSNLSLGYIFSMTHKITTEIVEAKRLPIKASSCYQSNTTIYS